MCCISCVAQSFGRSPRLASLWHLHSSMMMDAPDDGLCPWERDICDEELISLAEMQQQEADMAEAMAQEMAAAQTGSCDVPVTEPPTFGLEDSPAAVPCAAVVLPLSQQPSSSTQACSEEPTALTTQHILATSLPPVPKFRRLDTKTTVPESVCPVVPKPCLDLSSTVFTHSEEFVFQYFFSKAQRPAAVQLGVRAVESILHQPSASPHSRQAAFRGVSAAYRQRAAAGRATCVQRVGSL